MFLKHLLSSDFKGIVEWRDMWNDDVLPYLRAERLVAGPGIRIDRRPAGTLIRVVSSGGAGGGGETTLQFAAVETSPAGGFGTGGYKPVVLNTAGTYSVTSGAAVVAAVTPFI